MTAIELEPLRAETHTIRVQKRIAENKKKWAKFADLKLNKPKLSTSDTYDQIKVNLQNLMHNLEYNNYIYDPTQVEQLSNNVLYLIDSLDSLNPLAFQCRLFGKTVASREPCPFRNVQYKKQLLMRVYNAIVDPTGELNEFKIFIDKQVNVYPKNDASSLAVRGYLEAIVGGIGAFVSYIAGILTCGIGLIGWVPTIPLLVDGILKIKDSEIAEERDKLTNIQHIIGSFDTENEYGQVKRSLCFKAGLLKLPKQIEIKSDAKGTEAHNLHAEIFQKQIRELVHYLERTDLPELTKKRLLEQVDEVIDDPTKSGEFAKHVIRFKQNYPSDSVAMCEFKAKLGVFSAVVSLIAGAILLGFYGLGLVGFGMSALSAKYTCTQLGKMNLANVHERLSKIQTEAQGLHDHQLKRSRGL